ncbi:MAG: DUF1326 domain-containing protein [Acidobacteriota bacterium]|nr:DUF1326 domain-containing protein [Acidobacteriota bacterium]
MRKLIFCFAICLFLLSAWAVPGSAALKGDYIEARSSDVFTGPCFAMSEVSLTGQEAILAWKVQEGDWKGVSLNGLSVVAVVRANATLGDPYHNPYPARSVLIVDSRATSQQRIALAAFAASMAGDLLDHVVRVETAPIQITVEHGDHHGAAKLVAGKFAQIETRSLCQGDHLCGNESVFYPPLVSLVHSMPAFTLDSSYSGQGLGEVWKNVDKRSAFVGSF